MKSKLFLEALKLDVVMNEKQYNIIMIKCEDLSSSASLQLCIVVCAVKKDVKIISKSVIQNSLAFGSFVPITFNSNWKSAKDN
ncbi:unnamed protein product [Brugia pahangi]|uniref:Uncharacterized protein n=1 Tax=Brugia pahangi TaxID=6280 RepID=A0A0N4T4T9_BRUPA|nr:unnamed protein product [Brugia pahangi]